MGKGPGLYPDIGRKARDLLYRDYQSDHKFFLTTYAANGVTGTPICIPRREFIDIGHIYSIEDDCKTVNDAKKGQKVAIKIIGRNAEEQQKMFGRHFDKEDELVSHISTHSYDVLKENYWDELTNEERTLAGKLRRLFQ